MGSNERDQVCGWFLNSSPPPFPSSEKKVRLTKMLTVKSPKRAHQYNNAQLSGCIMYIPVYIYIYIYIYGALLCGCCGWMLVFRTYVYFRNIKGIDLPEVKIDPKVLFFFLLIFAVSQPGGALSALSWCYVCVLFFFWFFLNFLWFIFSYFFFLVLIFIVNLLELLGCSPLLTSKTTTDSNTARERERERKQPPPPPPPPPIFFLERRRGDPLLLWHQWLA